MPTQVSAAMLVLAPEITAFMRAAPGAMAFRSTSRLIKTRSELQTSTPRERKSATRLLLPFSSYWIRDSGRVSEPAIWLQFSLDLVLIFVEAGFGFADLRVEIVHLRSRIFEARD